MKHHVQGTALVLLSALVLLAAGCDDGVTAPRALPDQGPDLAKVPYEPGAASSRALYQVQLSPMGGTTNHGTVKIEIAGGYLVVSAHAEGLDPLQHIPEHIHVNPTCDNGGTVLISLNAHLSVLNEAPPVGPDFPIANDAGVLNYQASRSLSSLRLAVNANFGTNLASDEDLIAWLDLENRNVHMHASAAPFTPMTCGSVERVN